MSEELTMRWQLLVSGLALGSIYALLALSLVLIHKATGVVNFAQGEMATFGTFVLFALSQRYQLSPLSLLMLAIPLGACLGAVVERVVIRPMAGASAVNIIIATVGLWILFNSMTGWIWGFDPYLMPSPFSNVAVDIWGARVSPGNLGIIATSLVAMVTLYLFFEHTRQGTAMRAATMNLRAAQLVGIRSTRVSMLAWALGGALSVLCGALVAPVVFLDHEMMVSLLLKAFAAAVLGGFGSLPGAVIGGLSLGVLESLFGAYVSTRFKDSASFGLIVLVLMVRPAGILGGGARRKKV